MQINPDEIERIGNWLKTRATDRINGDIDGMLRHIPAIESEWTTPEGRETIDVLKMDIKTLRNKMSALTSMAETLLQIAKKVRAVQDQIKKGSANYRVNNGRRDMVQ